jgi:hypothetical protein
MDTFTMLVTAIAVLVLFALAVGFGVDSRSDSADPRRSPYPVGIS